MNGRNVAVFKYIHYMKHGHSV